MDHFTSSVEFQALTVSYYVRFADPEFSLKKIWSSFTSRPSIEHKDELFSLYDDWEFFIELTMLLSLLILPLFIFKRYCMKMKFVKKHKERFSKVVRFNSWIGKHLYYNGIIRFFMVIYLKVWITFGMQVEMLMDGSDYMVISELAIGFTLLLIIIMFPIACWWIIKKTRLFLSHDNIKAEIGVLYDGIHLYKEKENVMFTPMFLFRRAIFAAIPSFLRLPYF